MATMPMLVTVTVHSTDAAGVATGTRLLEVPVFLPQAEPCEVIGVLMAAIARIQATLPASA